MRPCSLQPSPFVLFNTPTVFTCFSASCVQTFSLLPSLWMIVRSLIASACLTSPFPRVGEGGRGAVGRAVSENVEGRVRRSAVDLRFAIFFFAPALCPALPLLPRPPHPPHRHHRLLIARLSVQAGRSFLAWQRRCISASQSTSAHRLDQITTSSPRVCSCSLPPYICACARVLTEDETVVLHTSRRHSCFPSIPCDWILREKGLPWLLFLPSVYVCMNVRSFACWKR